MSLEISTDRDRLDRARIHDWLSDSYWAADRSKDVMDRAIDNSLCFGAYDETAINWDRHIFGSIDCVCSFAEPADGVEKNVSGVA